MGRTREWQEDEVLAAARRVFRRRGYAGTSLRELEHETGVHPGSLYRAYGDKQGLFRAALRSYNEVIVDQRVAEHLHSSVDPLAGIHAFFTSTVEAFIDGIPGCLVTNSAVESVTLDPSLGTDVDNALASMERGFVDALTRLRDEGRLPDAADPLELAPQLLALYQGVLVLVRRQVAPSKLRSLSTSAIDAIVAASDPKATPT